MFEECWFVLDCIIYPQEGIYKISLENAKKVGLQSKIYTERFGSVPREIKTLFDFLTSGEIVCTHWSWESTAPFILSEFYKHAECIKEFGEDCIVVSE